MNRANMLLSATLLLAAVSGPLGAIAPMLLPEVPLTPIMDEPLAGVASVNLSAVAGDRKDAWLLLLVSSDSPTSLTLLGLLSNAPVEVDLKSNVVVVVEGSDPNRAAGLRKLFPNLAIVQWYADTTGGIPQGFALRDTPVAIGMKEGSSRWSVSGVLENPTRQRAALLAWIAPTPTAPAKN